MRAGVEEGQREGGVQYTLALRADRSWCDSREKRFSIEQQIYTYTLFKASCAVICDFSPSNTGNIH